MPRRLIGVDNAVNAGRMWFDPLSIDLYFEVLIQPHEPDKSVPAENSHDRKVAGAFQTFLKIPVRPGGMRCARSIARMTVKVRQKLVAELFQPDKHVVC